MATLLRRIKRKLAALAGRGGGGDDWRREVPSPILRRVPADAPLNVIDLGAHQGDFTRALGLRYRIARGILAEPLPHLAEELRREFTGPAYTVLECAVSDREGTVEFEMNETEATSSMLKIKRDHAGLGAVALTKSKVLQVRTRPLDDVVREAGWDRVDLLKIDVQGAEDKVLAGARETLRKTRAIWVESSWKPLYDGSAILWDIYRALDGEFRLTDVQPTFRGPDGELLQSDMLFLHR